MNPHISAALAAAAVAAGVSIGASHLIRPPQVINIHAAGPVEGSDAKARYLAATTWPEMEQREVDALTAAAKAHAGAVTIFCHEEAKCADLALNLDNAFESARWRSKVRMSPNVPPGITASTQELAGMLNAATGGRLDVGVDMDRNVTHREDYVAIGRRVE